MFRANFKDRINNKLDKSAFLTEEILYRMWETARIEIRKHSHTVSTLRLLDNAFENYLANDNYLYLSNNPIYQSLTRLQNSLAALFTAIDELTKFSVRDSENLIGISLTQLKSQQRKNPLKDIVGKNFVKLYGALKSKYGVKLEQNNLIQEFEFIFSDFFGTLKNFIVRPEYKETVRGRLIQDIIDLLPNDLFIDRNTLSKLFFDDEYYLMKTFFHSDNLHGLPGIQTYKKLIEKVRNIKLNSLDFYAGTPLNQFGLDTFISQCTRLLKFYNTHFTSSKLTLPELVLNEFFEYMFDGEFSKDSNVDWLVGLGGKNLELDVYNKEQGIGGEYHGPQHFELSHYLTVYKNPEAVAIKKLQDRVINDLLKIRQAQDNNKVLLIITYLDEPSNWYDILKRQYELQTGKLINKPPLTYEAALKSVSDKMLANLQDLRIRFLRNFRR